MINARRQGDDFAFEQVYIQFSQKLYAYFLSKTKSPCDAADLMQTVFFKLWKYRSRLNDSYTLDQQLFFIARNVLIDHIRKQNRQPKVSPAIDASNYPQQDELNMQLQHAISSLPELRKKIFVLHKLHGYSYKEIAEILSIPLKSVDNNLARALHSLRKLLLLIVILMTSTK